MFSFTSKVFTQVMGFLHDTVDTLSNAGRTARQGVRELQGQIREAEESVTDVSAELRLMKHEHEKAESAAEKWGRVAKTAAERGAREEAIEAVQQQVEAEELATSYAGNVARLTPMTLQLKARLSDLRQKEREMGHKTTVLDARNKIAKAEGRAARYLGNVGNKPGIDFDQLERKVDREEAKAAALADLVQEKTALNVDKRLEDYSRKDAIGEKLQALGLMGSGAAPAPVKLQQVGEKNAG